MAKIRYRTLDPVHTFSSGATTQVDIPRDAFISAINIRVRGQVDSGTTVTRQEDNPFNIIDNFQLVANGRDSVVQASGKMLAYNTVFDAGTEIERIQTPSSTGQSNQAYSYSIRIPFRLDEKKSANIIPQGTELPAHKMSSLSSYIRWNTASAGLDSGTSFAIDNTFADITLEEFVLTQQEAQAFYGKDLGSRYEDQKTIYYSETTKTIDAAYTNYGFTVDMPVNSVYLRSLMLARNSTARSDSIITDYQVKRNSPFEEIMTTLKWPVSQAMDIREHDIANGGRGTGGIRESAATSLYTGITAWEAGQTNVSNLAGLLVEGLDTRAMKTGDWQLRFNTGSPSATSDLKLLHKELKVLP